MTGLVEYFNKKPRLGVISTASKDGKGRFCGYWLTSDGR
jgi:hypothetical protein